MAQLSHSNGNAPEIHQKSAQQPPTSPGSDDQERIICANDIAKNLQMMVSALPQTSSSAGSLQAPITVPNKLELKASDRFICDQNTINKTTYKTKRVFKVSKKLYEKLYLHSGSKLSAV